jgi:endonuclease YncB( thermonuclease family)
MRHLVGLIALIGFLSLPFATPKAQDAPKVEAPTDPNHPIWTLVPTQIDRAKQHYVRIAPEAGETDRIIMAPDRPIRIGSNGIFTVAGKPVAIFGVVLPDRQKLCTTPGGARWACGIRAQATFSALLAARALECARVSPIGASVTLVTCRSGNDDIAEKLIGEGWAEAAANAGIASQSLQEAAERAHRGMWGQTIPEF